MCGCCLAHGIVRRLARVFSFKVGCCLGLWKLLVYGMALKKRYNPHPQGQQLYDITPTAGQHLHVENEQALQSVCLVFGLEGHTTKPMRSLLLSPEITYRVRRFTGRLRIHTVRGSVRSRVFCVLGFMIQLA